MNAKREQTTTAPPQGSHAEHASAALARPSLPDSGEALSTMQGGDCNDQTNALNPSRPELCRDGFDNDCDGVIDEAGIGLCI